MNEQKGEDVSIIHKNFLVTDQDEINIIFKQTLKNIDKVHKTVSQCKYASITGNISTSIDKIESLYCKHENIHQ